MDWQVSSRVLWWYPLAQEKTHKLESSLEYKPVAISCGLKVRFCSCLLVPRSCACSESASVPKASEGAVP